jgi:hypothetical protein
LIHWEGNNVRFRTRAATTIAALPLILGLAACGAEKADMTAADAGTTPTPTPAVTTTAPLKVAPAATHLTTASFLPAMKKSMVGKDSVRVTMRMVVGGQEVMTATGLQTMKPVAMQLVMNGAAFGGKAKMIVVKGKLYLSTKDVPDGKYVKIDPEDSSDPSAAGLGAMLDELDPSKTFASFDNGLKSVKFVRTETLDGRKLDRYAVSVDTAAALKATGKKMVAGLPKTLVYTIWMGSTDHLMYRIVFTIGGTGMTMTATDWGKPVTIKAPPASKVITR